MEDVAVNTMNMQGLHFTSAAKEISSHYCICGNPHVDISVTRQDNTILICKNCSRPLKQVDIAESKKLISLQELREIEEAKNNIRTTLELQMKKNTKRASELEFLLKRL